MPTPALDIDAHAALRSFGRIGPAVARGTARGLNDVAFQAMRFERREMTSRLDRPSRFTVSGTQVKRATATQDAPEAAVFVDPKRAKYLALQETGGELNRSNAGATRGSGSDALIVPVAERMRDALGGAGRNAVRRALKLPRTFLIKLQGRGSAYAGVFQRIGSGRGDLEPLLWLADKVRFDDNLHFRDDVTDYAQPRVNRAVSRAVDFELRRAVRA